MNTIVIGAATASRSSPAFASWAGGRPVAAASRHLRRAVSDRKEALLQRLEELVLELLAAIVLIAIFMIVTEPKRLEQQP
ncbi:MAG: hypothetical protein R3D05_19755 [Dongiaceae bacterium]